MKEECVERCWTARDGRMEERSGVGGEGVLGAGAGGDTEGRGTTGGCEVG